MWDTQIFYSEFDPSFSVESYDIQLYLWSGFSCKLSSCSEFKSECLTWDVKFQIIIMNTAPNLNVLHERQVSKSQLLIRGCVDARSALQWIYRITNQHESREREDTGKTDRCDARVHRRFSRCIGHRQRCFRIKSVRVMGKHGECSGGYLRGDYQWSPVHIEY